MGNRVTAGLQPTWWAQPDLNFRKVVLAGRGGNEKGREMEREGEEGEDLFRR